VLNVGPAYGGASFATACRTGTIESHHLDHLAATDCRQLDDSVIALITRLAGADVIVKRVSHFELGWFPGVYLKFLARLHRFGMPRAFLFLRSDRHVDAIEILWFRLWENRS